MAKKSKKKQKFDDGRELIAENRRARHNYEVLETFEAGVVLTGTEVRSLRENGGQLTDCFAYIPSKGRPEVWLVGVHIKPYSNGSFSNVDPDRKRKLLLHKRQIIYLQAKTREKGLTMVPMSMYFDVNGRVKIELALAKGRKTYDKSDSIAKRDAQREIERALRDRNR